MFRDIVPLAKELGISEGELLKLAREISHDGSLVSIRHMRKRDLEEMVDVLISIAENIEVFA